MHIEIEIPRPGLFLLLVVTAVSLAFNFSGGPDRNPAVKVKAEVSSEADDSEQESEEIEEDHEEDDGLGSEATSADDTLSDAEKVVRRARMEQALLSRREEILRYQLQELELERRALGDEINEKLEEEFREATRTLVGLIKDERTAEQFLLASLNQIWGAEGRAQAIGRGLAIDPKNINLLWPIDASRGISAHFHDAAYEERFGFPHEGTDIRALQGTIVTAAADGVVKEVKDNGLGFNSITIEHDGGFVTLYGHVTTFLVEEGQHVRQGDEIALSGGRPGSPGAGFSTGQHLHFMLFLNGVAVDGEEYLPPVEENS